MKYLKYKNYNSLLIIIVLGLYLSCEKVEKIDYLYGYWEINSVSFQGNELKNYPFSNTIDYFEFEQNNFGFRKKVMPKINGSFDITMHQINFEIISENKKRILRYGKGRNFKEEIIKLDSLNLFLQNEEGYTYKYKRFLPKNYLDG